jgi:hypothetical protein
MQGGIGRIAVPFGSATRAEPTPKRARHFGVLEDLPASNPLVKNCRKHPGGSECSGSPHSKAVLKVLWRGVVIEKHDHLICGYLLPPHRLIEDHGNAKLLPQQSLLCSNRTVYELDGYIPHLQGIIKGG